MIEFRQIGALAVGDNAPDTIMGWATRFGEPTDLGVFTEVIDPGAFKRTIAQQSNRIRLLAGHDAGGLSLGTITKLQERDQGLWLEARIADTSIGRDVLALAAGGHPVGLSIGFSVVPGGQRWSEDRTLRTLTEVRLHEVSVVGAPAYANAEIVGVRSLDSFLAATASLRAGKMLSAQSVYKIVEAMDALSELLQEAGYGPHGEAPGDMPDMADPEMSGSKKPKAMRAVAVPPAYLQDAAARGLQLLDEGYGGDGLVQRTVDEARAMVNGEITDDKIVRAAAWAARHAVDLRSPANTDPEADGWPGPGAVAHYLWGIDPTDPEPARRWFRAKADVIAANSGRDVEADEIALRQAANRAELVLAGLA